jgi:5-formyltetrahydrofolate cyclo-ligase
MVLSPTPALLEEKRALRRAMGERREALPADERAAASRGACARLLALGELASLAARGAGVVAGYAAFRGEIDPGLVLDGIRRAGVTVALPRVRAAPAPGEPRLSFHRVEAGASLASGPWGLLEPDAAWPEVPIENIDVLLVPGLAFDAQGRRLGYGKGYYDEVAGRVRAAGRGALIGLGYDFQLVDRCPVHDGDVALDLIVTEFQVLGPGGGAR